MNESTIHERRTARSAIAAGITATGIATAMTLVVTSGVGAVDSDGLSQVPGPIDGEAIYVPWTATGDMGITIDGSLADWAGVAAIVTDDGPLPSDDPATNGELAWSVIAEGSKLYVSATITDDSIIAGQHDDGYWNEDSIEVYLNATDDLDPSSYGPGIAQVRFSAVDIGNTDPTALTLSGTNVDTFDVEGLVFATPDGWGVEGVIDFSEWAVPEHGLSLGFQMHANGASTLDRDLKLIWSAADSADVSFENPSVFGTAVLFELGQTDVPAPADRVAPAETTTTAEDPATEPDEPAVEEPDTPTTTSPDAAEPATDDSGPEAAAETEDTVLLDTGEQAAANGDSSDSWRESPLLWIVPLALGVLSLLGYVMSRRGGSDDTDEPSDPDQLAAPLESR